VNADALVQRVGNGYDDQQKQEEGKIAHKFSGQIYRSYVVGGGGIVSTGDEEDDNGPEHESRPNNNASRNRRTKATMLTVRAFERRRGRARYGHRRVVR
jgi:hypothetical protein